ncbi:MAG: hypothetical protein IPQ07_44760 [Myxococcales bacterium]|nr:hypothetical protein [Myxococcales bacterium]
MNLASAAERRDRAGALRDLVVLLIDDAKRQPGQRTIERTDVAALLAAIDPAHPALDRDLLARAVQRAIVEHVLLELEALVEHALVPRAGRVRWSLSVTNATSPSRRARR